jgi:archaetidylinositol phosphate synthase
MIGESTPSVVKPWDSRLALRLVRPLRDTWVHPNHITTASLVTGLTAAALFANGGAAATNWAGALSALAALLDHADGELARVADKASALGHIYDRVADLVVRVTLFLSIGLGVRHGTLGNWAVVCGVLSAASLVLIFALRSDMANREVPGALDQPSGAGFDLNDVLYLVAPLAWFGWLAPFIAAAAIGTPVFCCWTVLQYQRNRAPHAA